MEEEFLLEALRWMMKSRLYDQKVIALQRQGLFGVYSPGIGQEACIRERLPRTLKLRHSAAGFAAEAEAGFLAGLADRRDRER